MGGNSPQSLVNTTAQADPGRRRSTSPSSPAARRGGLACGPARHGVELGVAEGARRCAAAGHRRGPGDEPSVARSPERSSCRCRCTRCSRPRSAPPPDEASTSTSCTISELWARFSAVAAGNPNAWIREQKSAEEIRTVERRQPDDRLPVSEVHELEQRRRHGGGADHVLGRAGQRARRARGPLGVRALRRPTATSTSSSAIAGRSPRRRRSSSADARALELAGIDHRRHRHRRPVLVLPVGRAARRAEPRARPRPPADPHRRTVVRRRAVEQLRDARHRHDDERPARPAGRARTGVGQRRLHHQARVRRVLDHAAGERFRHAYPQDEIDAMPRRELAEPADAAGDGDDRGVHGDALARRRARDGDRRRACSPTDGGRGARRATPTLRRGDVRRRVGRPRGDARRRGTMHV